MRVISRILEGMYIFCFGEPDFDPIDPLDSMSAVAHMHVMFGVALLLANFAIGPLSPTDLVAFQLVGVAFIMLATCLHGMVKFAYRATSVEDEHLLTYGLQAQSIFAAAILSLSFSFGLSHALRALPLFQAAMILYTRACLRLAARNRSVEGRLMRYKNWGYRTMRDYYRHYDLGLNDVRLSRWEKERCFERLWY